MISREDLIAQSVYDFVEEHLRARGYSERRVEMLESFPYTRQEAQLDHSLLAAGFDFDDQGQSAEMGSDLKIRVYTIQFVIFGPNNTEARNVANVVKFIVDGANAEGGIPLRNYGVEGAPELDRLLVDGVMADRQIIADPEPWQENVWLTTAKIEDTYFASLA